MTTKYSEEFKVDEKKLPQLSKVVKESLKDVNLTQEQVDTLCGDIENLILEAVPELVYTNMSDSYRFEGGFEECTKQLFINLKKIGVGGVTNNQNNNQISVRELYLRRKELLPVSWAYKTILKHVNINYPHIFKPTIKGDSQGKRYFVTEKNVKEFKKRFMNNKLGD